MVSNERSGSGTTSNGVHHGSLNLGEVEVVEVATDVRNDLGTSAEGVARAVVHDKIQVTLAVTLLLVLKTVVLGRNGVQARRKEDDLVGENGKFTVRAVLGGSAARETDDADNVTTAQLLVLLLEGHISSSVLGLAHDLDLDTFGANIVEVQLSTGRALGVNTTGNANRHIGLLLALLQTGVILDVFAQVVGDLELVRVRIRVLGLTQLVDTLAANLEVLL